MTPPTPATQPTPRVAPVESWTASQVDTALSAANAALSPLSRNQDQPWRVRCTPAGIEFYAVPHEPLTTAPNGQDVLLACGAALCNVKIALRATGVYPDVRIFPVPTRPDFLAIVRPAGARPATQTDQELAAAITQLHTLPDTVDPLPLPVPATVRGRLQAAAEAERAWLAILRPEHLPTWHALQQRTHQIDTTTSTTHTSTGGAAEPLITVIGTLRDGLLTRVQAGQATQRVLLTATLAGLSAVVRVPICRSELRTLVGGGLWPHTVLHLGS